jgi:hypothetical protein
LTKAGFLLRNKSPLICTAIGATGVVATAYLAAQGGSKAARILDEEQARLDRVEEGYDIPFRDKVELVWKCYIPAATVGTITIVAIVGAHRIGSKRLAGMAAAYTIVDRGFEEYRHKVVQTMGEKAERAMFDDLQQDRVNNDPPCQGEIIIVSGTSLFYDSESGRYFQNDMETVRRAMNDINNKVNNHNYASLTDFYDLIGLPATSHSEEVGWNLDKLMDIEFSAVIAPDGRPCISLNYNNAPIRGYYRLQ